MNIQVSYSPASSSSTQEDQKAFHNLQKAICVEQQLEQN